MSIITKAHSVYFLAPFLLTHRFIMAENYSSGQHSLAFVTVPNENVAKLIAHGLVQNKLAACVNIVPGVMSVYMWKGEVNEDSELILKIKTKTDLIGKLTDFVKKNHPYDVCEVVSVKIDDGNDAYLSWISDVLSAKATVVAEEKNDEIDNK